MKVNLDQILKDPDNREIMMDQSTKLTLRFVCTDALIRRIESIDSKNDAAYAVELFECSQNLKDGNFKSEQITLIKNRVANSGTFSPYIIGQTLTLLDG